MSANNGAEPLADPLQESRRLIETATQLGFVMRLLGGAAVFLQSPAGTPLLPRQIKDIDVATGRGGKRGATEVLIKAGYIADEHFNAFHGSRRLLFYDEHNTRKLDVFIGEFSMCHVIPIGNRLDLDPLTVPLAELMLTKLQIVQLTERDQRDIFNLVYHHDLADLDADFVAALCAKDWGLWRTTKATIEKCLANMAAYPLDPDAAALITERLNALWRRIEEAPKSTRWKLRSQVGDRVRWYEEPEE